MEKEELNFTFPEMEFTEEELNPTKNDKDENADEEPAKEKEMDVTAMVGEMKSAMASGKESGEMLSEKTNIEGTPVSEIYKGMGMAAV